MINRLQKSLWILACGAPIFITFSAAWWIHNKSVDMVSMVFIVIAVLFITISIVSFHLMKKKLAKVHLNVKKIIQNDKYAIGYVLSYLMPFASIAFDKYNPYIFLVIAVIFFIILIVANTPMINPLLLFAGYHFYDVETENGIGNYLIISKKSIRNKNELKKVIRITEYLLLDVLEER